MLHHENFQIQLQYRPVKLTLRSSLIKQPKPGGSAPGLWFLSPAKQILYNYFLSI